MSKHLDWSRITPDVAIWCQTKEEDIAFRQECEELGIRWRAGGEFSADSRYCLDEGTVMQDSRLYLIATPYSELLIEDKPTRSRLAEILGVEMGEIFSAQTPFGRFDKCVIDEDGYFLCTGTNVICYVINHPDCIIRKPRFSEADLSGMRWLVALGMTHIARDGVDGGGLYTYDHKPKFGTSGVFDLAADEGFYELPDGAFPTILPGQCVEIAEVLAPCSTK